VIKRELIDSEEGKNAQGIIRKYLKAQAREKSRSSEVDAEQVVSSETAPVSAATTPPVAS